MTHIDHLLLKRAADWADVDPDAATAAELNERITAAEAGDPAAAEELADAFAGTLQFGTAGLRGKLGPGPNRMNRVVRLPGRGRPGPVPARPGPGRDPWW